jgi:8-oxo-dGTP pyrophosphatase MutT (NUDIX family)
MKLLATIKSVDVNPKAKSLNYATFTPRNAARVVLVDDKKVALIHVSAHNYYMLPGGGIDDDDIETGLRREVQEEIGCEIEILDEVGSTDLYFDRWTTLQTDYCYIAKVVSSGLDLARTDFEESESHKIVWADDIAKAIELMKKATPKEDDGKIVRARDLLFLETAKTKLLR